MLSSFLPPIVLPFLMHTTSSAYPGHITDNETLAADGRLRHAISHRSGTTAWRRWRRHPGSTWLWYAEAQSQGLEDQGVWSFLRREVKGRSFRIPLLLWPPEPEYERRGEWKYFSFLKDKFRSILLACIYILSLPVFFSMSVCLVYEEEEEEEGNLLLLLCVTIKPLLVRIWYEQHNWKIFVSEKYHIARSNRSNQNRVHFFQHSEWLQFFLSSLPYQI